MRFTSGGWLKSSAPERESLPSEGTTMTKSLRAKSLRVAGSTEFFGGGLVHRLLDPPRRKHPRARPLPSASGADWKLPKLVCTFNLGVALLKKALDFAEGVGQTRRRRNGHSSRQRREQPAKDEPIAPSAARRRPRPQPIFVGAYPIVDCYGENRPILAIRLLPFRAMWSLCRRPRDRLSTVRPCGVACIPITCLPVTEEQPCRRITRLVRGLDDSALRFR